MSGQNQFLFYTNRVLEDRLYLEDQEAVHCTLVLRKRVGDIIYAIDGQGGRYKCGIDVVGKREVECTVLHRSLEPNSTNFSLAVAPTKNRDRLEWLVEKVVELGVKELFFLNTRNTERSRINFERIEKKAISAMKQSLRAYLPVIKEMELKDLKDANYDEKYIAHCIVADQKSPATQLISDRSKLVLIGPEGDFTQEEVELALSAGFLGLDLGEARLRTETAAIAVSVLANTK